MDVGAGYIDFEDLHLLFLVHPGAALDVFVHAEAADIGDYGLVEDLPERREFLGNDGRDAGILEAY